MRILHILDALTGGGPTRSLISVAKYAARLGLQQQHRVVTIKSHAYPLSFFQTKQAGIQVLRKPDKKVLLHELEQADIVQFHFWNNPANYEFLREGLPAIRLLMWFKIFGEHPPQIITSKLLEYTDFALATSPCTLDLPVFTSNQKILEAEKTGVVYGMADWSRLKGIEPRAHEGFNVGYIGTVNFTKMHPRYIPMSAEISIPNVQFIVCGGGMEGELKDQAVAMDASSKFQFRGYVENIGSVLEELDVFGYPLCEDTYATSEKSIQEAMYAGVPPVVFPHGGCKDLVQHEVTGLVVHSEKEYQEAIEYLYHHPEFRKTLGKNAANYAKRVFDSEKLVKKMHDVYEKMMECPKRKRVWKKFAVGEDSFSHSLHLAEALGDSAPQFRESLNSNDPETFLKAEEKIAHSSPLLTEGEGGINQYRNFYPKDPYLRLWSGLVLQKKKKHPVALKEFETAKNLGFSHWRLYWYMAQSAYEIQDFALAKTALEQVVDAAPGFKPAKEMLQLL